MTTRTTAGDAIRRGVVVYGLPDGADVYAYARLWHKALRRSGATVDAYINHGRWVADCPVCRSGFAVDPDVSEAPCLGCGSIHRVRAPRAYKAIERALLVRPVRNRNWLPGETAADVRAENVAHGLPPEVT